MVNLNRCTCCDLVGALAGTSVGALVWLDFKVFTGSSLIMSMYIWSILSRRTRTRSRLRSKDMINHITFIIIFIDKMSNLNFSDLHAWHNVMSWEYGLLGGYDIIISYFIFFDFFMLLLVHPLVPWFDLILKCSQVHH
jgi:hypothetical protein